MYDTFRDFYVGGPLSGPGFGGRSTTGWVGVEGVVVVTGLSTSLPNSNLREKGLSPKHTKIE